MSIEITTPPALEPVSLQEVKDYCRVTNDDDDDFLSGLIIAGRQAVEANLNRKLYTQTIKYTFDFFPPLGFSLPGGTVQSITSFYYQDRDDVQQAVSSSLYNTRLNEVPAVVLLKPLKSWPDTYDGGNAVEINYVAGWANIEDIPAGILIALKSWILTQFDYREAGAAPPSGLSAYERLLAPYRVYGA